MKPSVMWGLPWDLVSASVLCLLLMLSEAQRAGPERGLVCMLLSVSLSSTVDIVLSSPFPQPPRHSLRILLNLADIHCKLIRAIMSPVWRRSQSSPMIKINTPIIPVYLTLRTNPSPLFTD